MTELWWQLFENARPVREDVEKPVGGRWETLMLS